MNDGDLITDVRAAKAWVEAQTDSFDAMVARLREVEAAYLSRSGEFANLPATRPAWVQTAIDAASAEPGGELLADTRTSKAG